MEEEEGRERIPEDGGEDLRLCDFEKDLKQIEAVVEAMMMGEERYKPTLNMNDVVMEKDDTGLPGKGWEDPGTEYGGGGRDGRDGGVHQQHGGGCHDEEGQP